MTEGFISNWLEGKTGDEDMVSCWALAGLKLSRLARRASSRSMIRELDLTSGSSLDARSDLGAGEISIDFCTTTALSRDEGLNPASPGRCSDKIMQSSVRLRHMLSALRRS